MRVTSAIQQHQGKPRHDITAIITIAPSLFSKVKRSGTNIPSTFLHYLDVPHGSCQKATFPTGLVEFHLGVELPQKEGKAVSRTQHARQLGDARLPYH